MYQKNCLSDCDLRAISVLMLRSPFLDPFPSPLYTLVWLPGVQPAWTVAYRSVTLSVLHLFRSLDTFSCSLGVSLMLWMIDSRSELSIRRWRQRSNLRKTLTLSLSLPRLLFNYISLANKKPGGDWGGGGKERNLWAIILDLITRSLKNPYLILRRREQDRKM